MSTQSPVQPGEVLANKFRIERIIATGGMGVVAEATHLTLQQRVALKFLLPSASHDTTAIARFVREARAAVQLKSAHVVRVTDVGTTDDGRPYMVMELLEGRDLSHVISEGKVSLDTALEIMRQICNALSEAHALRIIHRDLKPSNIFVTADNKGGLLVKVLDFGISKHQDEQLALTDTAQVIGSPLYMSPEQLRAVKDLDPRTDLWSLGAILYEMLTGQVPFVASNIMDLATKVLEATPEPISAFRDDVPPHVVQAIEACLQKARDGRVASADAFLRMLDQDSRARITPAPVQSSPNVVPALPIDVLGSTEKMSTAPETPAEPDAASSTAGIGGTGTTWNTGTQGAGARSRGVRLAVMGAGVVAIVGASLFFGGGVFRHRGAPTLADTPAAESTPLAAATLSSATSTPSFAPPSAPSSSAAASAAAPHTSASAPGVTSAAAKASAATDKRPPPATAPPAHAPSAAASAPAPTCHVVSDGRDPEGNPRFKKLCN